jgi:sugar lactone lactonase YvrE
VEHPRQWVVGPVTLPTNAPAGVPILTARPVTAAVAHHGEGPVWHPSFAGVRWVDMLAGDILELVAPDAVRRTHVGTVAAAFRPRRAGGLVLADERRFVLLHDDLTVERRLPDLWADPGVRMNDGGADPCGNFWCGSMAYDEAEGAGALYRLTPDLTAAKVLGGVTISNGFGFSPDGTRAYYIDTPTRTVDVFDFADGDLTNRRSAVSIADGPGAPDGMTVDADGCLWVALFGGSAVHRYSPEGELLAVVPIPAAQVTACTFGGPDLDRLYVTTSRQGLDAGARAEQPLAGALFAVDVAGVRGLPVLEFAG